MSGFFDFQESLKSQPPPVVPARKTPAPRAVEPGSEGERIEEGKEAPKELAANQPLSITDFTRQIKTSLKQAFPSTVTLKGELSNYRGPASSGHHYFSLKDPGALLNAVMFANSAKALKFKLAEGMEVIATGRLDLYEQGGKYNFIVTSLAPLGTGALELAFRQLHAKLEAEGLFAPERKKPIPPYPRTVALVTSKSAAGLADQLKVLTRFPFLRIILVPVPVQGEGASARIANALDTLSRDHEKIVGSGAGIDLILLGRGGGSYEDLFEFSREDLARAVARCSIPIITGIGHEVDTAIADLIADHHAHTPTEAATFATRFWKLALDRVEVGRVKLRRDIQHTLERYRNQLKLCDRHPFLCNPDELTARHHQRVDDREQKLTLALRSKLTLARRKLDALESRLRLHDPRRVLLHRRDRLFKLESRLNQSLATRLPLAVQRLHSHHQRLARALPQILQAKSLKLATAERTLELLGPTSILARGYTLTTLPNGSLLRHPGDAPPGTLLTTRTADGDVKSKAV